MHVSWNGCRELSGGLLHEKRNLHKHPKCHLPGTLLKNLKSEPWATGICSALDSVKPKVNVGMKSLVLSTVCL